MILGSGWATAPAEDATFVPMKVGDHGSIETTAPCVLSLPTLGRVDRDLLGHLGSLR